MSCGAGLKVPAWMSPRGMDGGHWYLCDYLRGAAVLYMHNSCVGFAITLNVWDSCDSWLTGWPARERILVSSSTLRFHAVTLV